MFYFSSVHQLVRFPHELAAVKRSSQQTAGSIIHPASEMNTIKTYIITRKKEEAEALTKCCQLCDAENGDLTPEILK